MAAEKKLVELEIYSQDTQLKFIGRLLGLLTPEEYAGIIEKPGLRSKLCNVGSTTLKDIGKLMNVENMRLAFVVKKKNDTNVPKKTLLFTEKLDIISHVVAEDDITLVGKDGTYILLTEVADEQNKNNS